MNLTNGEDDPDALLECDCEVRCTEEAINADCPVCVNNPEWCAVGVVAQGIAPTAQIISALDFTSGGSTPATGDGYSWSNNTLTLTNFDMAVSSTPPAIKLPAGATIELNGTNTIIQNAGQPGINVVDGNLTIEGDGILNVTSAGSGITLGTGTLTINGGTISITATFNGLAANTLTINGGTLEAKGTASAITANYTVPNGYSYWVNNAGTSDPGGSALIGNDINTINSSSKFVKIIAPASSGYNYTLLLHTDGELYKNSSDIANKVTNDFVFGAGTVSITGSGSTWTLILKDGFDFTTSAATALKVPTGTTIQVNGNATVASTKTTGTCDGISSTGSLTINVAAGKTLTVNMGDGCTDSYGIYTSESFTKLGDGTLTVNAGSATTSYGINVQGSDFIMSKGVINATGNGTTGSFGISMGAADFTMTDGVIYATTNGSALYTSNNAMRVGGTVSMGSIPIKACDPSGAYTIDASFQNLNGNLAIKAGDNYVYNAKLGADAPPPPPPPIEPTPAPTPSGGSSSGSSDPKPAPVAPVIAPLDNKASGTLGKAIDSAASAASSDGKNFDVRLKNVSNFTKENAEAIIKKAKALGKPARVSSDIMSEDGKYVEVRVTLDPTLIDKNVRMDGYTRESQTFITQSKFNKHFENKITVISLGQEGKFGQPAKISAKFDFDKFDSINNLYFYSYDKKANKYTRIERQSNHRIDKNGYLHFTSEFGGDIIISDGPLVRK